MMGGQSNYNQEKIKKYVNILSETLSSNEAKNKNITLEDAGYMVHNLEKFLYDFPDNFSKGLIISKLCELIVGFGLVHRLTSEDRDFSSEDFPRIAKNAEKCFEYLKMLLKELKMLEHGYKRHFLIDVLLLCATHSKTYHWTSSTSISSCKDFLDDLLQYTQQSNLSNLLCDESFHPTIFKGILKKMRPSLMKDTWMFNPSSCYIFWHLFSHVKHPHLVDFLPDIFPPPFMFVSYHAVPERVLGVQCFDHLLDNIPPTLMKLDGKEDAIFHALLPLIHSNDVPIIEVLYPCILKLPMMRIQKTKLVYWGESDKILCHLLFNAEFQNNLDMKRLFLSHTKDFLECSPPFNHLKQLMKVVKTVLTESLVPDITCYLTVLEILKVIIKSCWPRMENHCFDILVSILEFQQQGFVKDHNEIYQLCEGCLTLLKFSCNEKFKSLTSSYIEDPDMPGVELLQRILKKEK